MSALPKQAMVLAAGRGVRMRPLTDHRPKPLVEVAGKALLDHTLDWLAASGVAEAVVNAHYLAHQIEAHVAPRIAPHIRISHEELLLETGGGVRLALPMLGHDPFFVINSDTICIDGPSSALARLAAAYDPAQLDALLLVMPVSQAVGYDGAGDFFVDDGGLIRRRQQEAAAPYVFTGVQILHPRAMEGTPEGAFSLNVVYNRLMNPDGTAPRVRALVHDGAWLHVGDPGALALANRWFETRASLR